MKSPNLIKAVVPMTLLMAAGASLANTAIIDGTRDASYGTTPLTAQQASVIDLVLAGPVTGAVQTNNSNTGGVSAYLGGDFDGNPLLVNTGLEIEASLAELGWDGFSPIRVCAFINGQQHDFISNQITNGLPVGDDQNPGEPRGKSFATSPTFDGDQFLTISATGDGAADPIDGVKGASYPGTPVGGWSQMNPTRFGNNTQTRRDTAGGSELNAVWAYRDTKGTPGDTSDDTLRLLLAGNLQTNNNKWEIFFDVKSGGQNTLLGAENPDVDFNGLRRMGTNNGGENPASPTVTGPGLTFDAGFTADYWIGYVNAVNSGIPQHFLNAAELPTAGSGLGGFIGGGNKDDGMGGPNVITANGPRAIGAISAFIDNSNNLGISSPGGGGGTDPAPTSDPATVATGMEFEIGLDQIGYDDSGTIRIGGFITSQSADFLSNQVIGGLPSGSNSLGSPAGTKDFSTIAGNQFVSLAGIVANPPALGIVADGTRDAAYGAPLWVNTNATSFGDNTLATTEDGDGSELNAVYAKVSTKNGRRTLHVFVAGNLSDFNRFWLALDVNAGGGQQVLRGDNANIDFNQLNNAAGLKWDNGFSPDFIITYHLGTDANSSLAVHFLDGAELLADGGGSGPDLGGRFNGGAKGGVGTPLAGEIVLRSGLGNNSDASQFNANGSELNNIFAQKGNEFGTDFLYIHIGGNLQPNFRKLVLFFDVDPARGQQRLIFDANDPNSPEYVGNPVVDGGFNALNRMGGPVFDGGDPPSVLFEGLRFESDFTADYALTLTNGNFNSLNTNQAEIFGNFARLRGVLDDNDAGQAINLGVAFTGDGGFFDGGDNGTSELTRVDINNSNTGGVSGGCNSTVADDSNPATVATGIEIRIPLSYLNWDGITGAPKLTAFILSEDYGSFFNQSLQSVCTLDLGEIRNVNFATLPGLQYVNLNHNVSGERYTNTVALPPDCIPCGGDANGDKLVNGADLSVLLSQFGQSVSICSGADFNGDGQVNGADLSVLLSQFVNNCNP